MASIFSRILIFVLVPGLALAADQAKSAVAVLAYYTYSPGCTESLKAHGDSFNQLAMDLCSVTDKGVVSGGVPQPELAFARGKGMATFATVSNYSGSDFNAQVAHAILTTPAYTGQLVADMLVRLKEGHYTGINIDFESITASDRNAYTAFIQTVAQRMKKAGYLTMISVPAKQVDDPTNSWDGAFDYKALGAAADILQVMTYDENGTWGKPGPVAGLDWVELCLKFAVSQAPPEKINMGVPAFGYDWDLTDKKQSKQVTWVEIGRSLASSKAEEQWDDASSSPHFAYTDKGQSHVVWGENARSLGLKMKLVAKYHVTGVSIYALGMENDAFWKAVHSAGF